MDDRLVPLLVVLLLIIGSISVDRESISEFGFKEVEGAPNNTLSTISSTDAKRLSSALQSIFSNQCQLGDINCPPNFDPFSVSSNTSMVVQVRPKTIYENTQTPLDVTGRLFNVTLHGDEKVKIDLTDGNRSIDVKYPESIDLSADGIFHLSDTVSLSKGHYLLVVTAPKQVSPGLNSTTFIDPVTPPITLEQVYQLAYQLVIVVPAFVGAIIFLPKWLFKKKQLKMLAGIFVDIDNTYSQNKSDAHEVEVQLEYLRKRYLVLLGNGKLDQNTFDLVERRITYLISKGKST